MAPAATGEIKDFAASRDDFNVTFYPRRSLYHLRHFMQE